MSGYDPQSWQVPMRQATWEQGPLSAGSNAGPSMQQQQQHQQSRDLAGAFNTQYEEVERALDNMSKSTNKVYAMQPRRDSMPMMGGVPPPFTDFGPRIPQRHSVDYDQMRPQSSSNLQNYYANQRHQPRPNEAEQAMQAKRRMAAQRERELRNYHQEQQYNRNVNVRGGSDRAISPNTMNEEDRRELIARQHRALYGSEQAPFFDEESNTPKPSNPASGPTSAASGRGPSPRNYDPFNMGGGQGQSQVKAEDSGQLNPREAGQQGGNGPSPKPQPGSSHENNTASPASNPPSQTFSLFESAAQQSSRTSTSSPGGSPPRPGKTIGPGVAPIGTRPAQASNPAFSKRSGTPSHSPLGQGLLANDSRRTAGIDRSTSSASNPSSGATKDSNSSAWGSSSGVWGNSGNNNKPVGAVWG